MWGILLHVGPLLIGEAAGVLMGVSGLHDGVVTPIAVTQIHKVYQLVLVAVDIALVRIAAQHVVHDDTHFHTGNVVAGTEGVVGIAADPAVGGSLSHIGVLALTS